MKIKKKVYNYLERDKQSVELFKVYNTNLSSFFFFFLKYNEFEQLLN